MRVTAVEEEEEKGRWKAGGEEEREKIDEGKDGLSAHGCIEVVRHLPRKREKKRRAHPSRRARGREARAIAKYPEYRFIFLPYVIRRIKALARNLRHV